PAAEAPDCDHQLDDPQGAAQSRADRRLAQAPHRERLGARRPGGQPAPEAAQAAREDDEAGVEGRVAARARRDDARPRRAGGPVRPVAPPAPAAVSREKTRGGVYTFRPKRSKIPRLTERSHGRSWFLCRSTRTQDSKLMVTIRLSRGGATKRPFYHIVVTDRRNRRDGRYIERLGFFNPIATGGERELEINLERTDYWLANGAQVSERVDQLIKQYRKSAAAAA